MKVKIKEIRRLCEVILIKRGLKPAEAKIVVADYLEGELLGKITHGLISFSGVIEKAGQTKAKKILVSRKSNNFLLLNANGQIGQLVAGVATKAVIKMAKKTGIAMVGVYDSLPFLRPGSQAEKIAENDLIGLVLINGGGPTVVPPGGLDAILATNPIGFAIPTFGKPIVCDMAISKKAISEVKLAKLLGRDLPEDSFVDKKGEIIKDPDSFFAALPFGDYKGFNLGILFEILTGSLVNAEIGYKKKDIGSSKDKYGKKYRGALFIAINPSVFTSLKKFKQKNSQFIKEIKSVKRKKGIKEIVIPGKKAYQNKEIALRRGWLEVDKKIIEQIKKLAGNTK
ncbi:MAG: Ldh family oxidoreductase [Candidatus Buchananbacteria bacterium]